MTSALLLLNALFLGFRHGVDWDHIAAIVDIIGSEKGVGVETVLQDSSRAIRAPMLYACGHGLVVVFLGLIALCFATILPAWIDPLMERCVGLTLLGLGLFVIYRALSANGPDSHIESRGSVLFDLVNRRLGNHAVPRNGLLAAFLIGVIHGIGAETGSQVVILTAVAGQGALLTGVFMLLSFVLGLLLCNLLVAALGYCGFAAALRSRFFSKVFGLATGFIGLYVGFAFLFGNESGLPDLQKIFG